MVKASSLTPALRGRSEGESVPPGAPVPRLAFAHVCRFQSKRERE